MRATSCLGYRKRMLRLALATTALFAVAVEAGSNRARQVHNGGSEHPRKSVRTSRTQLPGAPLAKGGVTAAATPVATPHQRLSNWRSTLFGRTMAAYKKLEHAEGALVEPEGARRFDLFDPFLTCPDGRAPVRFGAASDGGKFICADVLNAPDCVVYSLGSNGDFAFEETILERTACTVVTFDCTSEARVVNPRHLYVKKCLGSAERMAGDPGSWITLEAAMASMGHADLALLKIDIEGAEYDVLSEWTQDAPGLPRQVAVEVHYDWIYWMTPAFRDSKDTSNLLWPMHKMRLADLALFMSHLTGAGYGVVSREDNDRSPHCSEFTLLRVVSK